MTRAICCLIISLQLFANQVDNYLVIKLVELTKGEKSMKKAILYILVVALCVFSLATLTACGPIDVEDMVFECDKALDPIVAQDGVDVVIKADVYSVGVYEIPGDKITIQYGSNANADVQVPHTGSEVFIVQNSSSTITSVKDLFLVVSIPSSLKNYDLSVQTTSGFVSIDDLSVRELAVQTVSGKVDIDVEHAQSVEVQTASGNVELSGDAVSVNVDAISAKVDLDMTVADLDISSDSGKIVFEVENNTTIEVESKTGDIRGTIEGVKNQYTIQTEVWQGRCNVDNQVGDGLHVLEVEVGTGSAKIKFVR